MVDWLFDFFLSFLDHEGNQTASLTFIHMHRYIFMTGLQKLCLFVCSERCNQQLGSVCFLTSLGNIELNHILHSHQETRSFFIFSWCLIKGLHVKDEQLLFKSVLNKFLGLVKCNIFISLKILKSCIEQVGNTTHYESHTWAPRINRQHKYP